MNLHALTPLVQTPVSQPYKLGNQEAPASMHMVTMFLLRITVHRQPQKPHEIQDRAPQHRKPHQTDWVPCQVSPHGRGVGGCGLFYSRRHSGLGSESANHSTSQLCFMLKLGEVGHLPRILRGPKALPVMPPTGSKQSTRYNGPLRPCM